MKETDLGKLIQLEFSKLGHRLFRCNTGMGWAGNAQHFSKITTIQVYPGDVVIRKARPLHAGLTEGGSDLIGWTKDGRFLAVEDKILGNKTDPYRLEKQTTFITSINRAGGVAFFTCSLNEALSKINVAIKK